MAGIVETEKMTRQGVKIGAGRRIELAEDLTGGINADDLIERDAVRIELETQFEFVHYGKLANSLTTTSSQNSAAVEL